MRKNLRPAVIAALILILSILLLPNVGAASSGVKQAAIAGSAAKHEAAGSGQFKLASLWPQDDEENPISADLSITKLVDVEQATPGMNLTYTITVHNSAAFAVPDVTMNDPLPAGLEFVSLTKPATWTCTTPAVGSGGTVNCTNPSLAANADDVFLLVVNIPAQTAPGSTFTNVATVTSTFLDPTDENNSASATTTVLVRSADLTVTKVADSEGVNAGDNITYTITVINNGPFAADNATLSDTLPGNSTFVSLTYPGTWTCTTPAVGSGGTINCTNPSLAVNANDVFTLTVNVPSKGAQPGDSYSNTATVSSSLPDNNDENNNATATTTINSADLEVLKVDTPDPASSGSNLTYTITVQNNGPNTAADVSLSDTIPVGTTFVSLSAPSGWVCSTPAVGSGGTITCTIASLSGSAIFTLVVKIDSGVGASPGTTLTNTATATTTTPDPNPGNNDGSATTTIVNLRGWTTTGDAGATEDESNPARPVYTNFTAAVSPGSPVGAYTLRYNIQAMDGLAGAGANTRLRVRFRDEGEGSRVTIAIVRSPLAGGAPTTLGTLFDSDAYTGSSGFQTQEILMPALTFDFTQNVYWLEVTMTKSGAGNQPGFGSAQINRQ